jgi:hypothetical protein
MSGKYDRVFSQVYDELEGIGGEIEFLTEAMTFLAQKSPAFFANPNVLKQVLKITKKVHGDALEKQKQEDDMEELQTPSVANETERKEDVPVHVVEGSQVETEPEVTEDDRYKDAPVGNGGTTDKYVWTQTLSEVNMTFEVAQNLRSRDLFIEIRPQHLKVGIRGQPLLVDVSFVSWFCKRF